MADEAVKDVAPVEPAAAKQEGMPGNFAERLFRLENINNGLAKRVEFLEDANTKLQTQIREEAMRLLGMSFCSIGEQMLTAATSMHTFKAEVVSDERPVNDQTFYARRVDPSNPKLWAYHVLQGGQAVDVILERLAAPMNAAIQQLIATIPVETASVAFNVYKVA
jgi:hypothetical protein